MCFSATASFAVGGATAIAGVAALRNVDSPRALPMALVPMLFAAQQAIEGALWLDLGARGGEHVSALSHAYLFFAEVLWPIWVPVAVLLIESGKLRRLMIGVIALLGLALGGWLLDRIFAVPAAARIVDHSIRYTGDDSLVPWMLAVYLLCACGVLFLSSHRLIRLFGAVVAVGFAVSAWAHYATLISVWCFFAAAGSTVLYFHFRTAASAAPVGAMQTAPVRKADG